MNVRPLAAAALLAIAASACHKPAAPDDRGAADAGTLALPANVPAQAALPAGSAADASAPRRARCAAGQPVPLGVDAAAPLGPRADIEVGDTVTYDGGYAVGLVHRGPGGRTAAIALVDHEATGVRLVDLGTTPGDAPPTRAAPWGKGVLVAAYSIAPDAAHRVASRELAVFQVTPGAPPEARPAIPQTSDDSFAFDLASTRTTAVAVWDEATPGGRGVIRALEVTPGATGAAVHPVSPPDSDVEAPRLVSGPDGFSVFWLARHPEAVDRDDERAAAEVPGEERTFGWIESSALDAHGVATGPVRRLTSPSGHVSAYDVEPLAGDGGPALVVVARDDGEAVDGSGGVLVRVRVTADRVDPPLALVGDGLGRGGPGFVAGNPPWLGWVGPDERLRLLPLDATGAPSGPPSVEDALPDARPLGVVGGAAIPSGSGPARVLVAAPSDPASPLRVTSCER